ncbi:Lysophospholipase L1 [Clostridium sp. DSM 8431]|uniref:SGNH/GDSL hydrolase family protein n=1 Tax=Clostridium sp. DSM 8431 TaxID=1761781 RepID=UPI0008E9E07C|nr:SGNH/GDSL hydrolase family protein [Clostridium sp. DSM 8431]SFU63434.1 Lysophospholipase L1 [Clostridium sp. DSM 8431]
MSNSKKGLYIIIALAAILIVIIGAGKFKEKKENKINNEEYIASMSKASDSNEEKEETTEEEEKQDTSKMKSAPEKLRAKEDVKVLMLGDAIAMSSGRTSENGIWSEGIKSAILKEFGSKASMEVIAQKDATTATGLNQLKNADLSGYDIVILCYGYNDNKDKLKVEDVKADYKAIVDKIMKENNHAMIMSVLESSLELNNPYRSAINEVSTTKSLITVDMKNAFVSSGIKESSLASNGLPNDKGYQVYTQAVESKLKQVVG